MIELPEATTIARQMNAGLKGKRIEVGNQGNSPHKFAFHSDLTPEEYEAVLKGKTVGEARVNGSSILISLEPDYILMLGVGGERIVYHPVGGGVPGKHQLFLSFTDATSLTVSIQGWGAVVLIPNTEVSASPFVNFDKPSPLSDAFTLDYFQRLFAELPADETRSVKFFIISKPGLLGIGNGCLQDILWHAKIHPRRRAVELSIAEQQALYTSIRSTLEQMVAGGGRDSDYDLYDHPGGYRRILYSKSVGQPCPACGTSIEKDNYLGGAVYFCPHCQPDPRKS